MRTYQTSFYNLQNNNSGMKLLCISDLLYKKLGNVPEVPQLLEAAFTFLKYMSGTSCIAKKLWTFIL